VAHVQCWKCGGTGRLEFTGIWAETLQLVIDNDGANGAELGRLAGCSGSAMCHRLAALQELGLVEGVQHGRQWKWYAAARGVNYGCPDSETVRREDAQGGLVLAQEAVRDAGPGAGGDGPAVPGHGRAG
jgi:hypothetical protein